MACKKCFQNASLCVCGSFICGCTSKCGICEDVICGCEEMHYCNWRSAVLVCKYCIAYCEACSNAICSMCEGECVVCSKRVCNRECHKTCDFCSEAVCDMCCDVCSRCNLVICEICYSKGEESLGCSCWNYDR